MDEKDGFKDYGFRGGIQNMKHGYTLISILPHVNQPLP